jgi:hypothetical protein
MPMVDKKLQKILRTYTPRTQLAEQTKIPYNQLTQFINGFVCFSPKRIQALEKFFGIKGKEENEKAN